MNVYRLNTRTVAQADYSPKKAATPELQAGPPALAVVIGAFGTKRAAGLTQQQLAQRMNTTQSAVARLEGGHSCPSTSTLLRLALATGTRLKISFEAAPRRVTGR